MIDYVIIILFIALWSFAFLCLVQQVIMIKMIENKRRS